MSPLLWCEQALGLNHFSSNIRAALRLAVVALVWLLSGVFAVPTELQANTEISESGAAKFDVTKSKADKVLFTVRAKRLKAEPMAQRVLLRGYTAAKRSVAIKAELSGRVIERPISEGQKVDALSVLCVLAPEDRLARLAESQALVKQAELEYQGAIRLKQGGYQSKTAIAAALARLNQAKALLKARELDVARLQIRAPFSGVIDALPAEQGALIQRGETCAQLLELSPLLVRAQVAENEALQLKPGQQAEVYLNNGSRAVGVVHFIAQEGDATLHTFRVEIELSNEQNWRAGLSAKISVPVAEFQAHLVSPSLLSLDDKGGLGVRTLDQENHVRWRSVVLLSDGPEGMWVTGLPEEAAVITVGHEYVSQGQEVAVQWADESKASNQDASAVSENPETQEVK